MRIPTQLAFVTIGFLALTAHASMDAFLNFIDGRMLQASGQQAPPPLNYSSTLKCDQCIRSGFVFCIQG